MEFVTLLWLPILLAAIGVFAASFLLHAVIPFHRNDVWKIPGDKEDVVLDALRRANLQPGDYGAPHAGSMAGMKDPAFVAKAEQGPLAFMTITPAGVPSMGPRLAQWFLYSLVISAGSAYLEWRIFGPDSSFRAVFKLACVITFLSYAVALPQHSIWYRRSWITTLKSMIDGIVYGLVTAAAFAWLWPK